MTHVKVLCACLALIAILYCDARWEIRSIPDEAALMEPAVRRRSTQLFRTDGTPPPRGAVVWFEHPLLPPRLFISRVVGTAGDRIVIENGRIVRDGRPLPEDHVEKRLDAEQMAEVVVPEGHVYLANDVRGEAGSPGSDSRRLGPVPLALVVGWTTDRVSEREPHDEPRRAGGGR